MSNLGYLAQVQRGIDFIEHHLEDDLALRAVSKEAGISHWHFQRIFKALTGETLKTYVRSRRLANSLDRLLKTDTRILDIAIGAGFESQESFTRAFSAAFGMTPGAYRKLGDKSLFLQKVRIDEDYLSHIHRSVSLVPEIVEMPSMRLVGFRTELFGSDSDKNNIAQRLPPLWDAFLARITSQTVIDWSTCYGVVEPANEDEEGLVYHAAVRLDPRDEVPEGMSEVLVPARRYAKFTHQGASDALDHSVNYIYSTWLAQAKERHSYGADLEIYDHRFDAMSESSVMEYAIPLQAAQ